MNGKHLLLFQTNQNKCSRNETVWECEWAKTLECWALSFWASDIQSPASWASHPSLASWPHTNLHKLQRPGRQFWELRQSARSACVQGRNAKRGRQMGKWYTLLYLFLHIHTHAHTERTPRRTQTQSRSNKLPHKCGVVRHVIDFILFLYPPDAQPAANFFPTCRCFIYFFFVFWQGVAIHGLTYFYFSHFYLFTFFFFFLPPPFRSQVGVVVGWGGGERVVEGS